MSSGLRTRAFLELVELGIDGPVVSDILGEFGDLESVYAADRSELRRLDGVGRRTVEKIEQAAGST